jgi:branched-chain amino acid transport system substrate-binding protein
MKKFLLATAATALCAGAAHAEDIKLGIILGFTGPLESITPDMASGAELAMKEVTDSGALLDGSTVTAIRADSTCIDAAAATSAAERLITSDRVSALVGADCSGVTGAILSNVAVPNGIVMISPSATSPGLSTAEDNDLFFRTAPSDARQGQVISDILTDLGYKSAAVSYVNNDYGKGLADAFEASFKEAGGEITINAAHEDQKADYAAEVGALAAAGGDVLVVAGYVDGGGSGVTRAAIDAGAFDVFHFPDGMTGQALVDRFGAELDGSTADVPGTDSPGSQMYIDMVGDSFNPTGPFSPESYDAAALIMLAMQAAGSSNSADLKAKVMEVANAPGEEIFPGELAKGLQILAEGGDIDYVGASAVELIGPGESAGNYREIKYEGGQEVTASYR